MADSKMSWEKQRKITWIVLIAVVVLAIVLIVLYTVISDMNNKKVDEIATDCNVELNSVDMDLSSSVDKNKAFANFVLLKTFEDANLNEDLLTYYNDSNNKFLEIKNRSDFIMDKYLKYFDRQHEVVLINDKIDLDGASKGELEAAYNALTNLSNEIGTTLNSNIWTEDTTWSILWGNKPEDAKQNYSKYKNAVDNEASDIKAKLDTMP